MPKGQAEAPAGVIAVIGAGTMGPGIALTFAAHGQQVALCDVRPEALARAERVIAGALAVLARHGAVPADAPARAPERIRLTTSLAEAGREAGLLFEAIIENAGAKRALFAELDSLCPPHAIFASNTSYLNAFACTSRPEQTVIAHWFAPPHILPLVEVVRGPQTRDEVVATVVESLRRAGKAPVVMQRFVPGFAVNRLQRALGREVFFLLQNGYITAEDLDLAVKASLAPRMQLLGVVQRYDFAGLDLTANNLANESYPEAPVDPAPEVLMRLVRAGHLGAKTGRGFYDYAGRPVEDVLSARDEALLRIMACAQPFLRPGFPLEPDDPGAAPGGGSGGA